MTQRLQRRAAAPVHSAWTRVLALACLLLVVSASSAQAAHIHGQWLPEHAQKAGALPDASQLPGDEEHCSLCVAMHSALPVSLQVDPVAALAGECGPVPTVDRVPQSQWHFAMFSRPPPAVGNTEAN